MKEVSKMNNGYRHYNGTRFVGGTAALLHKIKKDGGLSQHYQKIIQKSITDFIQAANEEEKRNYIKLA